MAGNFKVTYNVDMAFCIDVTGSMDTIIEIVQKNALNFYQDVKSYMEQMGKHIDALRVRIIAFRDYFADGADAMMVTKFFSLPQDADKLKASVESLVAKGGGDEPEDGLEALAYAIKSDWCTQSMKKRHVIVLWTDDDAHALGYGKGSSYYPKGMAGDMRELTAWWGNKTDPGYMNQEAKRLVLFAPDKPAWTQISGSWDNVLHYPSEAGKGLVDVDYEKILAAISKTI